jgi:GT2 family glycosyltransferase
MVLQRRSERDVRHYIYGGICNILLFRGLVGFQIRSNIAVFALPRSVAGSVKDYHRIITVNQENKIIPASVTVVTVTYGNRKDMLVQVIDGCRANGIANFVIVNNGASWDVETLRQHCQACNFFIVDMNDNKGPAAGYGAGIQKALENECCELLWLLDDDLAPEKGCLVNLASEYHGLVQNNPEQCTAVLAARSEFVRILASDDSRRLMNPRKNTFLEFSVADIWPKLRKRLPWRRHKSAYGDIPNTFSIQMAPYGGLLFGRSVVERIGLPDSKFILYVDDYEYTYRITQGGGSIMLVPSAMLRELESCWNSAETHNNSLNAWLSGPDFRAYYTARNMTYFEQHLRDAISFSYYLNKYFYFGLLYAVSLLRKRTARMQLLREAINAGASRRLGLDIRFPLP